MIRIVSWNPSANRMETVPLEQLPATHASLPPESVVWIDMESPTPEEEARVLGQFLKVHPLTLEDITKPVRHPEQGPHLPKVEEFADYLFVVVNPLPDELSKKVASGGKGTLKLRKADRPQLSTILTHSVLITHHTKPVPCIHEGFTDLERHCDNLRRGPDYLFHLIVDHMVDDYAPVVESIADRLDRLEKKMYTRPSRKMLRDLLKLKRLVTYLRKTLVLEREVLARLIRGEFRLVDAREIAYYRNVYDHLVRYTELTESAREMVSDLMQTYLATISNRLNEVMKTLTVLSTIGMIGTFIAGVYGMNFENMPEIKWTYGYAWALSLMVGSAIAALIFYRWRKWI